MFLCFYMLFGTVVLFRDQSRLRVQTRKDFLQLTPCALKFVKVLASKRLNNPRIAIHSKKNALVLTKADPPRIIKKLGFRARHIGALGPIHQTKELRVDKPPFHAVNPGHVDDVAKTNFSVQSKSEAVAHAVHVFFYGLGRVLVQIASFYQAGVDANFAGFKKGCGGLQSTDRAFHGGGSYGFSQRYPGVDTHEVFESPSMCTLLLAKNSGLWILDLIGQKRIVKLLRGAFWTRCHKGHHGELHFGGPRRKTSYAGACEEMSPRNLRPT